MKSQVRVLGMLVELDIVAGRAVIERCEARVAVDTALLEDTPFHLGELLEFIGELYIRSAEDPPVLRARIVRNVTGLNLQLYQRVVADLRTFLQEVVP